MYDVLWRQAIPATEEYREVALGYRHIAALTGLGLKTIQRNMKSLEQKLTLKQIGRYDSDTRQPKTYRIYSFKAILDRRREAGLEWARINRQGVTLTIVPKVGAVPMVDTVPTETAVPTMGTAAVPTVTTPDSPHGGDSFSSKRAQEESTTSSAICGEVGRALRGHLPVDDDAVRRLVERCRRTDPAATTAEIQHFIEVKISQHRQMRNVKNPIGLLIESVPKCFSGKMIEEYREQLRRRHEQGREEARRILEDPQATQDERELAKSILGESPL